MGIGLKLTEVGSAAGLDTLLNTPVNFGLNLLLRMGGGLF